jgi:hypothetical protein
MEKKYRYLILLTLVLIGMQGVMLCKASCSNDFTVSDSASKKTTVFKKKKSKKTYTVTLPAIDGIRFKNKKQNNELIPKPSLWKHISPIITHIDDSMITVKFHPHMDRKAAKEFRLAVKKIEDNESQSTEEKENSYFLLAYSDSATVRLASIKSIRFSRFNFKTKKFYSKDKAGFNEQRIPRVVSTAFRSATVLGGIYVLASVSAAHFPVACVVVGLKVVCWDFAGYLVSTKGINFKRWELKPLRN